jgi:UDP-glucose 4-epimerase
VSALEGRAVLVTGASGFLGAALARRLTAEGAVVHGTSRRPRTGGECRRWWQVDPCDADQVRRVVEAVRPGVVFHLASLVTGSVDAALVLPTLSANLVSTVNLLVALTGCDVDRVVFAGSMEEPPPQGQWVVPPSPYAAAKLAAGAYARMFRSLYGTPIVWLRLFMVYGPGQLDERKLIPYSVLAHLGGEVPAVRSEARNVDWLYVDDAVDAMVTAATARGVEGATLDVGTGRLVRVRTVVEEIARIVGAPVAFRRDPADRPLETVRVADVEGTAAALGWSARVQLEEGLRRTVEWYRSKRRELERGSRQGVVQ